MKTSIKLNGQKTTSDGKDHYNYVLISNTLFEVKNASCLAAAIKLCAEHLQMPYNGIFIQKAKILDPCFKSHRKIIKAFFPEIPVSQ